MARKVQPGRSLDQWRVGGQPLVRVRVYVEGGAQDSKAASSAARRAFSSFVSSAGLSGIEFRPYGGRRRTFEAFCIALKERSDDDIVLLLLDSEEVVASGTSRWDHIATRQDDRLEKPDGAHEEHLFLMVAVMETWLLADLNNLIKFFGQNFAGQSIPSWPDLEKVPKADIFKALRDASSRCVNPYQKGDLSFRILETASLEAVAQKCTEAKRFMDRLSSHQA